MSSHVTVRGGDTTTSYSLLNNNNNEYPTKRQISYLPLPKATLPPVVHSTYVPHKPKTQGLSPAQQGQVNSPIQQQRNFGPPKRQESSLDIYSRQHSYNAADYELHRRVKIQQRAHSQLLDENPHLQNILTPKQRGADSESHRSMLSPLNPGNPLSLTNHTPRQTGGIPQMTQSAAPTPKQSGGVGVNSPPQLDLASPGIFSTSGFPEPPNQPQTARPQRRGFAEMMGGGRGATETNPITQTFAPSSTATQPTTPQIPGNNSNERNGHANPRAGAFFPRADAFDGRPTQTTTYLPRIESNLNTDELSNSSDSFVMVDESDDEEKTDASATKKPMQQPKTPLPTKTTAAAAAQPPQVQDQKSLQSRLEKGLLVPKDRRAPVGSERPELLCCNLIYTPNGYDFSLIEPNHGACLMSIDVVHHMRRATKVIKHGRRGRPHTASLLLAQNTRYFTWDSKNKNDGENVIRFTWITKVQQGQDSAVFARHPDERVAPLSITVHYTRPEKYNHFDDSDDEFETKENNNNEQEKDNPDEAKPRFALFGGFASKLQNATKPVKRSAWRGPLEDMTLDIVIEDPNDWLIWFNGLKLLADMSTNKLMVHDPSLRLNKQTKLPLVLPMLTGYPSSQWLNDSVTGLSLKEQYENEQHAENNQIQVQLALTRKETVKEIIRRTSSYAVGQYKNMSMTGSQVGGFGPNNNNTGSQIHIDTNSLMTGNNTTDGIAPMGVPTNGSVIASTTMTPRNADGITAPSTKTYLNNNNNNNTAFAPPALSHQGSELDLLTQAFPSPWKDIRLRGESDVVHSSWLQQIIYHGPKPGHAFPWQCAYTIAKDSSSFERMVQAVGDLQRGILLEGVDLKSEALIGARNRIYNTFHSRVGGLSLIIMRSKDGDILGGYGTSPWAKEWGFIGTPDCFVFNVVDELIPIELDVTVDNNNNNNQNKDDDEISFHNDTMASISGNSVKSKDKFNFNNNNNKDGNSIKSPDDNNNNNNVNNTSTPEQAVTTTQGQQQQQTIYIEENIQQLHIYRWCGEINARFFQMINKDSFGFGANPINNNNNSQETGTHNPNNNNNTDKDVIQEQFGQPNTSTGSAWSLNRNIHAGFSYPCPVFKSPQLTKEKAFDCWQFELWVPVPEL